MKLSDLEKFNYDLPEELIAKVPAEPRDSSRLFAYATKNDTVALDIFSNLKKYLPQNCLLVFNDTRVLPARARLSKPTGGLVEVLFLVNEYRPGDEYIIGMAGKRIETGWKMKLGPDHAFEVIGQDEHFFKFKPLFDPGDVADLLIKYGSTPTPKYLGKSQLDETGLRERYQSVFAKRHASAAAPTASLHFTERLMETLREKGIVSAFVTLHVGLGTFAPLSEKNFAEGKLHKEYFEISPEAAAAVSRAKREGCAVVAVGTTALRALEAAAADGKIPAAGLSGATELFVRPPYEFKIADGLITNFHLPKSSLMLLVESFLRYKRARRSLTDLYREAIQSKFRFYSFGDAMLII